MKNLSAKLSEFCHKHNIIINWVKPLLLYYSCCLE
jgi:hypothetical protein